MHPKVTILMPACNAAKHIAETIQSVLSQTYTDFELLIVDDGSTDDTVKVIRGLMDKRIRLLCKEKEGISAALNAGLQMARGIYIARLDADCICMPRRLARQVIFLDGHPAYLLVGSDAEYICENGEYLFNFRCAGHTNREIMSNLYRCCPFIHTAVMYRREAILRMGGYSRYAHQFEDYLLWVQLLKTGKCCNLPEPLVKVRINPSSAAVDEKWRGRRFRRLKYAVLQRGGHYQGRGKRAEADRPATRQRKDESGGLSCFLRTDAAGEQPPGGEGPLACSKGYSCHPFSPGQLYFAVGELSSTRLDKMAA